MKVGILCGGYGTRIRDVADNIPKPMIPVGGYPILWHIMKYYAGWEHNEFVLMLGYKGDIIRDFFLNYRSHTTDFTVDLSGKMAVQYHADKSTEDWNVTLVETGLKSMTGARIKRAEKYFSGEDNFMLTYGDGVGDINVGKLLEFHNRHGKILTVTGVQTPAVLANYNAMRAVRSPNLMRSPRRPADASPVVSLSVVKKFSITSMTGKTTYSNRNP